MFLDSVRITQNDLEQQYDPADMAAITVYKDTNAVKLIGPEGRNGVVYLETRKFARNRYWKLFSTRSPEYRKAVPNPESDSTVAYILNGQALSGSFEGTPFDYQRKKSDGLQGHRQEDARLGVRHHG